MATDAFPSAEAHPWGSFAAERYLLQNWSPDPNESDLQEYRRSLIRSFLNGGTLISDDDNTDEASEDRITPTEEEIALVLRPWRSDKMRAIAGALKTQRTNEAVVVRTHYGGTDSEDEVFQEIIHTDSDEDPSFDPDCVWWRFLNDASSFQQGAESSWWRVLETLPELAARGAGQAVPLDAYYIRKAARQTYMPSSSWLQNRLRHGAVGILDEEAFRTSKIKLHFLDGNGNSIRMALVDAVEIAYYMMMLERSSVGDSDMWCDAEVGEKYKAEGEIGMMIDQKLARVGDD